MHLTENYKRVVGEDTFEGTTLCGFRIADIVVSWEEDNPNHDMRVTCSRCRSRIEGRIGLMQRYLNGTW